VSFFYIRYTESSWLLLAYPTPAASEAVKANIIRRINKFGKVFVIDISTFCTLGHLRYLALPAF